MKKIWLVYPYGVLPGEGLRPDRPQMIADSIKEDGHQITTWISSFDHKNKKQRVLTDNLKQIENNVSIRIVKTIKYKKNISLGRIFSEFVFAINFLRISIKIEKPNLIILTEPSIFFGFCVLRIIKKTNCKLIIDTQDLWPEVFRIILPKKIRKFYPFIFKPLFKIRENTFSYANAIISVSDTYRFLSIKLAPNLNQDFIKTVYYSVDVRKFRSSMNRISLIDQPDLKNIKKNEVRIIFASTLGNNYDIVTILKATEILSKRGINFKLLIAGSGPLENLIINYLKLNIEMKVEYLGNPNIDDLADIYKTCQIGLSSYVGDSPVSLPIKAFHYAAAGLAVINSLEGEYSRILDETQSGINYESGNINSLINSILFYCNNPILLNKAQIASYNLSEKFDYKLQYSQVKKIVNNLLEK